MSSGKARKRRVVVRLHDRDRDDPAALLAAVRNALSGHGVRLELRSVGEAEPPAPDAPLPTHPTPIEALDAKGRTVLEAIFDREAKKVEKEAAVEARDAARLASEIDAIRRGAGATVVFWLAQGVRYMIEFVPKLAGVVAAVAGRKGDKQ